MNRDGSTSLYLEMFTFDLQLGPSNPSANIARLSGTDDMKPPSFLEVEVNAQQVFIVHRKPLLARCGRMMEAVKEASVLWTQASYDSPPRKLLHVQLHNLPGGPQAFEMVARFCYTDSDISITSTNVAMLRCAADYMEMSEDFGKGNLVKRTEGFLRNMVFWSWEEAIAVLKTCDAFLPEAEKTLIVQRCATSLADKASSINSFIEFSPLSISSDSYLSTTSGSSSSNRSSRAASETWWFEDLSTLSTCLMEKVVKAMTANRASDHRVLAKFLLHYLRSSLPVLGYSPMSLSPKKLNKGDRDEIILSNCTQKVQREVIETVVTLFSGLDRGSVSCRSLLGLRRIAIALRAAKPCRRELERMIGCQLEKATLDNVLIPALPPRSGSLYDVDLVLRLVHFFLKDKAEALLTSPKCDSRSLSGSDSKSSLSRTSSSNMSSPVQSALTSVGELMDKYLAEIAADSCLRPSKFQALAEALPDYARLTDDGLYRAVDIYLESHPTITEAEATRLFKVLNYQKLGLEACKSVALNARFPASFAIQVVLLQQAQLRAAIEGSPFCKNKHDRSPSPVTDTPRVGQQTVVHLQCSNFEFVLRQNQELKKNLKKMQTRVVELESSCKRTRVEVARLLGLKRLFNSKLSCQQ